MPLYDYACDDCGPFREWQPMSEATAPVACSSCGALSPREVTAPFIANMNPYNRVAHQRNEKSANEPQVVRKKAHGADAHAHPHRHHGHAQGKAHGHGRPWMIGH